MRLITQIRNCKKCCELVENRTNVVIGQGPVPCDLLFLGEAPGRKEDETGIPFCGVAGNIMEAAGFRAGLVRNEHYHILNVLKCRPPENRDPSEKELENCRPFLLKQLQAINPQVIIAFGRYAQAFVLDVPPSGIRVLKNVGNTIQTRFCRIDGKPIYAVLSYHPAYVARNRNSDIAKAFNRHFKIAKTMLKGKTPNAL